MNTKSQIISRFLILVFSITAFCCLSVSAQNSTDSEKDKLFPPKEENFVEATGVVLPWVRSRCNYHDISKIPYCINTKSKKLINGDLTNLYNADGSLWYQINNRGNFHTYTERHKNTGFLPYAVYGDNIADAILRVVSESPNWYEVEVNVKTGATKFVLKSEPNWAKINWEYWLAKMYFFATDDKQQKLLDQPGGKVIEELADINFTYYAFLDKTDGDWALVRGMIQEDYNHMTSTKYQGWIRWRKDGKLVVNDGWLIITKTD